MSDRGHEPAEPDPRAAPGAPGVEAGPPAPEPEPGPARTPLGGAAAALSVVYLVWYLVDLVVLGLSPSAFNAVHQQFGGPVPRAVFAVLVVGVLFHTCDGLRRIVLGRMPRWTRHDALLQAAARFVTLAVGIPVALVVLWPAVRTWWAR